MDKKKCLFILAGNYKQARWYAQSKRIAPHEFVYVTGPHKIMGCSGCVMILVGTWKSRKDALEIIDRAIVHGFLIKEEHI